MTLYNKYRPQTLDEVRGQDTIVKTLDKMLSDINTCPHAFLLTGPSGCGKTSIARIVANRLGCHPNDCQEIDNTDLRGIDTIREIKKESRFLPLNGKVRVWIFDEVQKVTSDGQAGLLKILEDTPNHVYFVLCTTDPQKLLPTLIGRCTRFDVKTLEEDEMVSLLRRVVHKEKQQVDVAILEQIAMDSLGHARNALVSLEKVLAASPEDRMEIAKSSAEQQNKTIELCRALIKRVGWKNLATIIAGLKGVEPEDIRRAVLGYCQAILLKEENDVAGLIMEFFMEPMYEPNAYQKLVFNCYSVYRQLHNQQ
jgi:DNA polymerase-3 subunit gamma/tau